jgi:hypothetical protein
MRKMGHGESFLLPVINLVNPMLIKGERFISEFRGATPIEISNAARLAR